MKKLMKILMLGLLFVGLTACNSGEETEPVGETDQTESQNASTEAENSEADSGDINTGEKETIELGVVSYTLVDAQYAIDLFNEQSEKYQIEEVMFDDITTPNVGLNDGDIHMNFYQHNSFLKQYNDEHGTDLQPVGGEGVYTYRLALYSEEYDSLEDFQEGDQIVVSQDTVNRGNELRFLEETGLITLAEGIDYPSTLDIVENPMNLNIVEVGNVFAHMDDENVKAGVAKPTGMIRDGRDPNTAIAFASEDILDDYQMLLVTRPEDVEQEWAVEFFNVMKSKEMQDYFDETYGEGSLLY